MYNNFFGFQKTPFDIVPNPELLFMSKRHKIALDHLEFGLMSGAGFILLTGEVGTGKTTLIRNLIRRSIARDTEIAIIFQTNVTAEQLLNMLLTEFELPTCPGDKPAALDQLNNFFLNSYIQGRKVLIIVDEAQNLSFEALEELRMLSNLQSDDRMLLQILLVGQPELKQKLMDPSLTQFAQRIAVNYHLMGLSPEETRRYVAYRLAKVGGDPNIFSADVLEVVHKASGGVPRAINLICGGSLLYAYADERPKVNMEDVRQAIEAKSGLGVEPASRVRKATVCSTTTAPIKPPRKAAPKQEAHAPASAPAAKSQTVPKPAVNPTAPQAPAAPAQQSVSQLAAAPQVVAAETATPLALEPAPADPTPAPPVHRPMPTTLQPAAVMQQAQRLAALAQPPKTPGFLVRIDSALTAPDLGVMRRMALIFGEIAGFLADRLSAMARRT